MLASPPPWGGNPLSFFGEPLIPRVARTGSAGSPFYTHDGKDRVSGYPGSSRRRLRIIRTGSAEKFANSLFSGHTNSHGEPIHRIIVAGKSSGAFTNTTQCAHVFVSTSCDRPQ